MHKLLTICIAMVWLVNGLYCKVLGAVPRHEQIVAQILGASFAKPLTTIIGLAEIVMFFWILSRWKSQLNAIIQILIVIIMNILERILVPDMLLWGAWNAFFALLFVTIVYLNEFHSLKQLNSDVSL